MKMRRFISVSRRDRRQIVLYMCMFIVAILFTKLLVTLSTDPDRIRAQRIARLNPYYRLEPVRDFYKFPCHSEQRPYRIRKRESSCVRTVNWDAVQYSILMEEHCQFVPVRTKPSICTYKGMKQNESLFFSWEAEQNINHIENMMDVLSFNPKMYYFDTGHTDGAYCMAAASQSNRTVCMNGNYKTIIMLMKSAIINHNRPNVSLIWNILSDKASTFTHQLYEIEEHRTLNDTKLTSFEYLHREINDYQVQSVTLDDLTGVFNKKRLFMRINLDFYDVSIFLNGDNFFGYADVRIIHVMTSHHDKALRLAEILEYHGLFPYADLFRRRHLHKEDKWPTNVYFLK